MSNSSSMPKIVILDDDHFPEGRVTSRILPKLQAMGLQDLVVHIKTYDEYRQYLETIKDLDEIGVLVMDSSLYEDGKPHRDFQQTLPLTYDMFRQIDRYRAKEWMSRIMPASGVSAEDRVGGGTTNNRFAENYLTGNNQGGEFLGYRPEQMLLAHIGGLAGNPDDVITRIIAFYQLVTNIDLKKEGVIKQEGDKAEAREANIAPRQSTLIGGSEFFEQVIQHNEPILSKEEEKPFEELRHKLLQRLEKIPTS